MPWFMQFFHQATNGTYKAAPATVAPVAASPGPGATADSIVTAKTCPVGFVSEPAKSDAPPKKCPFGFGGSK